MILTITEAIDLARFREEEEEGYVTCRKHPEADLYIWNYTNQALYSRAWNEVTLQARGLITTEDGTIVSRPLKKFFNLHEYLFDLPNEQFVVYEKVDGYLGVSYWLDEKMHICTRGCFDGPQALRGDAIFQKKYGHLDFDPEYTYLFEIIYPEGRLVVDYGEMEDLILLAVIHTKSGKEIDIHQQNWPFPVVKRYDGITDFAELQKMYKGNQEGFVVRYESGERIKVKFEEYVRLHVLSFQTTNRTIWEYLKEGKPLNTLLDRLPDELYAWIRATSAQLSQKYASLYRRTHEAYKEIIANATISTPIKVGETLTYKECQRLYKEMERYLDACFKENSELCEFLNIVHGYKNSDKGKITLHDAIWKSLYPKEVQTPKWAQRANEEDA